MKRLVLIAAVFAPLTACETMALYEGDRDPFARLVEVMEPLDISPSDRGAPAPLPVAQPLAPPPSPNRLATPQPPTLRPTAPAAAQSPAPLALSAPAPAVRRPLPAAARLAVRPPSQPEGRLVLDQPGTAKNVAQPVKPAPAAGVRKPLPLPTQPATPAPLPVTAAKQPAPPAPTLPKVPSPAVQPVPEPPVAAPPKPAPALPVAPTPPPPVAAPPKPAPALPVAPASPPPTVRDQGESEANTPTAREQGRPLIKRTNKVTRNRLGGGAGFTSADGQMGAELGTDIGRAARPVAPRSPQSTRQVISAAKGDLAECYVNEQLFQEDAKGTVIVIIEVPKELPNLPRIETSDFTDTMNVCLLEAVRHLPFPGDPDGAVYRLRVPFRFRPD